MPEVDKPPVPPPMQESETPLVVDARELFRGRREVWIEHNRVRYRLRVTRRNKLILQK